MAKDYTLDNIKNLQGIIKTNYKTLIEDVVNYYILRIEWHGKGCNGGAYKQGVVYVNDGTPQTTKFTKKQIYQRIKIVFNVVMANKLRDLYLDLINDDISEAK